MPEQVADSHYVAEIIYDEIDGETVYLVLEYDSGQGKQVKFPGGTNNDKPGETVDETLHRELRKETGLVLVAEPKAVFEKTCPARPGQGLHRKYAFLSPFSQCAGELRTIPIREDGDGGDLLSPPFWRTAEELLDPERFGYEKSDKLFPTHIPMLEAAKKHLALR